MRKLALVAVAVLSLGALGAIASAETVQKGGIRVNFEGKLTPKSLPRSSDAPVRVSVSAKVSSGNGKTPPPMQKMSIAINKYGHLNRTGMPVCHLEDIQPATTADALAVCKRSLVGEGRFLAEVLLKGQAPFPSDGKVYAFNGEVDGRPAILAHVYGTQPAPASYTIAFMIGQAKGTFGTTMTASLPPVKSGAGYITGIYLSLGKTFSSNGKRQSYFAASCPAPKGFSGAPFAFAKASVGFQGGRTLGTTLTRRCKVKG
jgi:hypothetical protein